MADAGSIYAQMGANLSNMFLDATNQYHKEHVTYDQQAQLAEALSRIGIKDGQITQIDPNVKDKAIQPVIDKKVVEGLRTTSHQGMIKNAAALEAVNRIAMHSLSQIAGPLAQEHLKAAQEANKRYPVTVGNQTYPLSAAGAASAGLQQQRYTTQDQAAAERAKLAQKREERAARGEGRSEEQLDIQKQGLGIRKQGVEQKFIASAPETKFFNETGLTPQILLSPNAVEQGYTAQTKQGKPLGDIDPLQPGVSLKQFKQPPTGWETFWQTVVKNKPSTEMELKNYPVVFTPKPGGAYRESEYKYPSANKDPVTGAPRPAVTTFAPHPEGEFLRIGDNRIPYQQAAQMRATAVRRKAEALDALKTLPLPMIKKRLGDLGYDPNDQFFGLPQ